MLACVLGIPYMLILISFSWPLTSAEPTWTHPKPKTTYFLDSAEQDPRPNPNQDEDAKHQSGTSSILQSPKWGLKGHGCSLHLQNQDREPKFKSWVYQRPVSIPNKDQDANHQSGTSSILQSPIWGLKGHECSFHFQNQDRGPEFRKWVYQRPVTILESRSRFQTSVRILQPQWKPLFRT